MGNKKTEEIPDGHSLFTAYKGMIVYKTGLVVASDNNLFKIWEKETALGKITFLPDNHPLFEICKNGDAEGLRYYLEKGISVYAESENNSGIHARVTRLGDINLLDILGEYGLNFSSPHNVLEAPLFFLAIRQKKIDLVEFFLSKGADINATDKYESPAINSALTNPDMLKFLLSRGAAVDQGDYQKNTPFLNAARGNQIGTMQILYKAGADINKQNDDKRTPLIICSQGEKTEALKWLLDHGANINAKDWCGKTALDWARENKRLKAIEILEKYKKGLA